MLIIVVVIMVFMMVMFIWFVFGFAVNYVFRKYSGTFFEFFFALGLGNRQILFPDILKSNVRRSILLRSQGIPPAEAFVLVRRVFPVVIISLFIRNRTETIRRLVFWFSIGFPAAFFRFFLLLTDFKLTLFLLFFVIELPLIVFKQSADIQLPLSKPATPFRIGTLGFGWNFLKVFLVRLKIKAVIPELALMLNVFEPHALKCHIFRLGRI